MLREGFLKKIVIKWILPILMLLVAFIFLIFEFFQIARAESSEGIYEILEEEAINGAGVVRGEIELLTKLGGHTANIIESIDSKKSLDVIEVSRITKLFEETETEFSIIANDKGNGVTGDGEVVNVSRERYFCGSSEDIFYTLIESGSYMEDYGLVITIPMTNGIKTTGALYLFYNLDNVWKKYKEGNPHHETNMTLLSKDGIIWSTCKTTGIIRKGKSFLELIKGTEERNRTEGFLSSGNSENSLKIEEVVTNRGECAIVTTLGIGGISAIMTYSDSYVEYRVDSQWKEIKVMANAIIALFMIFIVAFIWVFRSVNINYMEVNERLAKKADIDLLTDVYNKVATEEKIREYILNNPKSRCLLCLVDIDNFKNINDTRGHAFGDQVLKEIALRLQSAFRVSDIIGRIGGDEFLVFVKNLPATLPVEHETKKIMNVFHDFQVGEYVKYSVGASIGVSEFSKSADCFENLYKTADKAVYKAKKAGKNRVVVYDGPPMME